MRGRYINIRAGGEEVEVYEVLPDGDPVGAIICWHGKNGNGKKFVTDQKLDELAKKGWLILAPSSEWRNPSGVRGWRAWRGSVDVELANALVERAWASNVPNHRVATIGWSYGGSMVTALYTWHIGMFAAYGMVAMPPKSENLAEAPQAAAPVWFQMGMDDGHYAPDRDRVGYRVGIDWYSRGLEIGGHRTVELKGGEMVYKQWTTGRIVTGVAIQGHGHAFKLPGWNTAKKFARWLDAVL